MKNCKHLHITWDRSASHIVLFPHFDPEDEGSTYAQNTTKIAHSPHHQYQESRLTMNHLESLNCVV